MRMAVAQHALSCSVVVSSLCGAAGEADPGGREGGDGGDVNRKIDQGVQADPRQGRQEAASLMACED